MSYIGYARPIKVTIDYAQFKYDSNTSLLEVYYTFPDTAIVYKRDGSGLKSELSCTIEISNTLSTLTKRNWVIENRYENDTLALKNRSDLLGMQKFVLPSGQYIIKMNFQDVVDPRRKDSVKFTVNIRNFDSENPSISDIQFAQKIEPKSEGINVSYEKYLKGENVVLPLPTAMYVGNKPELHSYIELYNFSIVSTKDSLTVKYIVLDNTKNEVFDVVNKRQILGDAQIDIFNVSIDVLMSGVYFLKTVISYWHGTQSDSLVTFKKFYILNPEMPAEQVTMLSEDELFLISEFATLSDKRVEEQFRMVNQIANSNEIETYQQLNTSLARQKFFFKFWFQRDPNPNTPVNERYEDFKRAIDFARRNYKCTMSQNGWDSDRGKILLKYGFPTQIDRKYFSSRVDSDQTYPHEIWYYDNVQGGALFVFVDFRGLENFTLVHSTVVGEVNQPNWYQLFAIKRNSNTDIQKTKGGSFNNGR